MPLQRRLPKIGFRSAMKASRAELTLDDLMRVAGGEVTLAALIEASLVPEYTQRVKIILSGKRQEGRDQGQGHRRDQGREQRPSNRPAAVRG